VVVGYNGNDLITTQDLLQHLSPQIELREKMSADYGVDLRSKSDAQIAEAVIRKLVSDLLGYRATKPIIQPGTRFQYRAPSFLKFRTQQLQDRLAAICSADFIVDINGSPIEPPALEGQTVKMGAGVYRLGIGGLHSSETCIAHLADDEMMLMDVDVTSYYPSIILQCGLSPKHLGEPFLKVYRNIFTTRVAAKKAGNSTVEKVLKIVLNGSFGKFGSKYSVIYSPDLMIQVTVTGQLALLMLIEALELDGISVASANTDGIVLKFRRSRLEDVRAHIKRWEQATGFAMEETHYRALYSRDVNNYIAVKLKGGTKGKGDFADISISKNPSEAICNEAVVAFLEHGIPLAQTIICCRDIRKFVTVQRVTGGAVRITKTVYDDALRPSQMREVLLSTGWHQIEPGPLSKARFATQIDPGGYDVETAYRIHCGDDEFTFVGKVVRFYIGRHQTGALHYMKKNKKGNQNKVPGSAGAVPLMELPDEFPNDVDYEHYIASANKILKSIGAM
jgi:hypothetical protein